jgi:prepilin-type N-terminal cleavage/methylation domain-containing protein
MTHTRGPTGDGGFSMVELLVALAISSLIVVGIGGLFAYSGELRSRSEQTTRIQAALIDLRSVASVLRGLPQTVVEGRVPAGFELLHQPGQGTTEADRSSAARVYLQDTAFFIQYQVSGQISSVDLSPFDRAAIEYLVRPAQSPAWVSADQIGSQAILGVRLSLYERHRHWPLAIWMQNIQHVGGIP